MLIKIRYPNLSRSWFRSFKLDELLLSLRTSYQVLCDSGMVRLREQSDVVPAICYCYWRTETQDFFFAFFFMKLHCSLSKARKIKALKSSLSSAALNMNTWKHVKVTKVWKIRCTIQHARSTWQLLHSVKRQTRKSIKKVIEICANTCKPWRKNFKMLVKFQCEHMKVCQSYRGAKLSKKHMEAAQVNDKTIRENTSKHTRLKLSKC